MSKYIFVKSEPLLSKNHINVLNIFAKQGIMKMILVCEKNDRILTIARNEIKKFFGYMDVDNPEILFPEVLKNLNGNSYQVLIYEQVPRVFGSSKAVQSNLIYFLAAVVKKQNARVNVIKVDGPRNLIEPYKNRKMHLTLNDGAVLTNAKNDPKLLTYEETGYCALIPRPKSSSFELVLLRPFGWKIWSAFGSSLIAAGIIWRLYKGRGAVDSVWRFFCGIFAFFLNQSIAFRNNHIILTTMLQIIFFAIIILSCLYQGELSAYMIEPPTEPKLSTFDELYESDYKLMVSGLANSIMQSFDNYERIRSRINASGSILNDVDYEELANDNYAIVMQCYLAEYIMESYSKAKDFYYQLDHQILKHYVRLDASYNNQFLERLQELMDWSFEAGLSKAWDVFQEIKSYKPQPKEEEIFLKLKDFEQIFVLYGIGLLIATMVFIMEILIHKYSENLYMRWIYLKDEIFLWRNSRRVRRFRVRPAA